MLIQCGSMAGSRGHSIRALVTLAFSVYRHVVVVNQQAPDAGTMLAGSMASIGDDDLTLNQRLTNVFSGNPETSIPKI